MAKKKDKPQVINNIRELNLEIDYDKLAEAIVKAQNEADKPLESKKSFVSNSFLFWIALFFKVASILGIVGCMIGVAVLGLYAIDIAVWNTLNDIIANVFTLVMFLLLFIAFAAYCIVMWRAGKEIEQEKDKNFIVAVFSGIVSFAALIVALVALFKGVG